MRMFKSIFFLSLILCALPAIAELKRGLIIHIDDNERNYDLFIPDKNRKTKRPLVIMFHGYSGNSDFMTGANNKRSPYKIWLKLAQENNFLLAVPNGLLGSENKRGWNDCRADSNSNPDSDDVKFTLKLINRIKQLYPIDTTRIYATGTSNGGNMVIRLAMETPKLFAAVAPIVASNPVNSECKEKHLPISILFMNGTEDPLLPYQGGKVGKKKHGRGMALSTPDSVKYWINVNETDKKPAVFNFKDINPGENSRVVRYNYKYGKADTEVILYKIINGGHTEPSREEKYRRIYKWIVGNQNHDIEMADEVWTFFKRHSR